VKSILASLAATTLAVVSPAHADPASRSDAPADTGEAASSVYSIDIGSHVRWFGDTSAAIVSTDALAGVRLTVGRSLTTTTLRHRDVEIGLFARWVYAATSGKMFDDLDTDLRQHTLGGGLRAEAPVVRRLSLVGQAELGMARSALTVTRDIMTPVDDHRWAPYGATSLGADLLLATGKRLRVDLGVDVGYLVTVPVELRALPGDRPAEDLSIATTFAGIGKLDTRGWTYSMSLRGSF